MQKEVLPSNKLQDHVYEEYNPFRLREDNLQERNCQNHPSLSHIEQEYLIPGKIHIQCNSNKGHKYL